MPTIKRGENAKVERTLFYNDGATPLPLSELATLRAEIVQYGRVIETYTYLPTPDPVEDEIEAGDTTNEVRVHLTKAVSATLKEGAVYFKIYPELADASFVDGEQLDIIEWTPFDVEL